MGARRLCETLSLRVTVSVQDPECQGDSLSERGCVRDTGESGPEQGTGCGRKTVKYSSVSQLVGKRT